MGTLVRLGRMLERELRLQRRKQVRDLLMQAVRRRASPRVDPVGCHLSALSNNGESSKWSNDSRSATFLVCDAHIVPSCMSRHCIRVDLRTSICTQISCRTAEHSPQEDLIQRKCPIVGTSHTCERHFTCANIPACHACQSCTHVSAMTSPLSWPTSPPKHPGNPLQMQSPLSFHLSDNIPVTLH